MNIISRYIIGTMLCLSMMLMAAGCSEDGGQESGGGQGTQVRFLLFPQAFEDVTPALTRALPTGFLPYEELTPHVDINRVQIQAYFTNGAGTDAKVQSSGIFSFHEETEGDTKKYSWTSTIPSIQRGKYYVYGFMPAEDANNWTIAPYQNDYSKGAVLTINGLSTVSPGDVCVVVGVKKANNMTQDIKNVGIELGKFEFESEATDNESYAYLLLDHIYSGLNFKFSVDPDYNELRTIKMKRIALTSKGGVATVNATVNVTPTTDGSNPLGAITFTTDKTGNSEPAALYDGERELGTTPEEFLACIAPGMNTTFELETDYNVYDKKGNLIREVRALKNNVTIGADAMTAGQYHTVSVVVKPTYLYVLSEQDLENPDDNPKLVIN